MQDLTQLAGNGTCSAEPTYSVYRSSDDVDFCIAADGTSDHGDTAILGKKDEFCIQNDGFCIESDEVCVGNDKLCIKIDELCITNDEFCIKL